jgi:hypothetical protein
VFFSCFTSSQNKHTHTHARRKKKVWRTDIFHTLADRQTTRWRPSLPSR